MLSCRHEDGGQLSSQAGENVRELCCQLSDQTDSMRPGCGTVGRGMGASGPVGKTFVIPSS